MTDSEFFFNFVHGQENRSCVQFLRKFAYEACENTEPVLLLGPSGAGKTHLLMALYRRMSAKTPSYKALYQTGGTLIDNIICRIWEEDERYLSCYLGINMLLIDDLSFLVGKQSTQQELICFLKNMQKQSVRVLCAIPDCSIVTEPIVSRFPGTVLQLAPPSNDTIKRLIEFKASRYNLTTPNKKVLRTALASKGNGFLIEGTLKRCAFQSAFAHTYLKEWPHGEKAAGYLI